eukprot:scaffold252793_cov35-Attheya_sp.AAC.2
MDSLNWTEGPLFRHPNNGKLWDSAYFRKVFLYPGLRWLRDCGMVYLQKYDYREHYQVEDWFYSMGWCYRQGGWSAVSLRPFYNLRAATLDEVYEHGRWRKKGKVDSNMPAHYREWDLRDHLIYPKRLDGVAVDGHLVIITFMSSILANWLYLRYTSSCRGIRLKGGSMCGQTFGSLRPKLDLALVLHFASPILHFASPS